MGISIGNKIELVRLDQVIKNEPNKKVYISKIYDLLPNNKLQIAMPILDGKIVPLSLDEKYTACFYTAKGLLQCNVIVTARYKIGNLFYLEVLMLGELSKVQRREFYRYKCMIDGKLRIVSDYEYETGMWEDMSIPEENLDWSPIRILDISGGGAKIAAKNHLDRNEVVKLKFTVVVLDEVMAFSLYARILSSTRFKSNAELYEQRLEFMKIVQEDRDRIIKFIFENERMARAKETGLK